MLRARGVEKVGAFDPDRHGKDGETARRRHLLHQIEAIAEPIFASTPV